MRNSECVIYISLKSGYTQTYYKEGKDWIQSLPNGNRRKMTAEQLLSHILPTLREGHPATTRVELKKDIEIVP